ncbi:MAG: ester cyclase [Solirubrobacteraceae bacterium]
MSVTMSKSALPGVGSPLRVSPVSNLERMYALDEAWNARDWETFDAYHDQDDVVVYWPGREKTPTLGGPDHRAESVRFSVAFPDNRVTHPYDILFGDGEYTAFVGPFSGSFTGPLELPDGSVIEPTGKSFEVVFSTIARWQDGKIVEEYLKYDNASFMQQIGLA